MHPNSFMFNFTLTLSLLIGFFFSNANNITSLVLRDCQSIAQYALQHNIISDRTFHQFYVSCKMLSTLLLFLNCFSIV